MEPVIAAVLAASFVVLTVAFHLPERLFSGRLRGGRRIEWDARSDTGR